MIIKNYIETIYNDLKQYMYMYSEGVLCELDDLYFYDNHIPDYNKYCVQQLYLLRYSYAYIFEYMEMYTLLFGFFYSNRIDYRNSEILSIGSGAGLDLYALDSLYNKNLYYRDNFPINYVGLDIIDWQYTPTILNNDNCTFKFNLFDFYNFLINQDPYIDTNIYSNIIFFPKSIGEIQDELLKVIPKKIYYDNIYLLISFAFDEDRLKKNNILKYFLDNGFVYEILFDVKVDEIGKKYINDICKDYIYPENIKNILNELTNHFCTEKENCRLNCNVNRYPVITNRKFNYSIIKITRL